MGIESKKTALVCGAGGFIGSHLVKRLKKEGYWVRGVDLKYPKFSETEADDFVIGDLRDLNVVKRVVDRGFDEVYQLAADMGGAIFVFTGENDAEIMHNSALINLNVLDESYKRKVKKIFYSSSACIYPEHAQEDPNITGLKEEVAYPAYPDSEYGWEKLFSERLYLSYMRNKGMNVRIARFHNIYGPEGSWNDGREKAPARFSRQIAESKNGQEIKIGVFGDGKQTRSFLYIDECLEGIRRLMDSDHSEPINLGSDEKVSMNEFIEMISNIAGTKPGVTYSSGPTGVRGRNSDNSKIRKVLGWAPNYPLREGMEKTYAWIEEQVQNSPKTKKSGN
jgi:GDP-D-mannose 3', 5'-epimerase